MEEFIKIIEEFNLSEGEKQLLLNALKKVQKNILVAEFKYNRTLIDKAAITNVLNASLKEMEVQKKQIEIAKNEINQNLIELDKQKKLADKQASLDKIRAEIASMRNADDLQQITPLIWEELKKLGIPFIRCGIFIMDDEQEKIHCYLSTPQGSAIAVLHLPYQGMSLIENIRLAWQHQRVHHEHWSKKDFNDWSDRLFIEGYIASKEAYESGAAPENLELHFIPFKQGLLYIGNSEILSKENLDLAQSLANAFSVAYDRYEDFNRLEIAKQKVEATLGELRAAQEQLIQQEKLASLGQLTAGIAHEIKNPLNFVNNFSDLSSELIEEIMEERSKNIEARDENLIDEALSVIKQNLQKIHEHGTRADGIVKSMLLHSRGSEGRREPTQINSLIAEYVNLAYHGMRASKDPINVNIDLNLDEQIEKIPLITEDFSRVILNLSTNAFDAMRDKLKMQENAPSGERSYMPRLTVNSYKENGSTMIVFEDNGPGIPENIKDKILQPFFTTKKGTEGTGLGLSISNDIVTAHGGTMKIESEAGRFSRFIIKLT